MRIPSKDFIDTCDTGAAVGTTWHINHDACTMGADTRRRLYITKKDAGTFLAYCHNCSGWGVVKVKQSRGEWVKYIPRNKAGAAVDITSAEPEALPSDISFDIDTWPPEVRGWLQRYHILNKDDGLFNSVGYMQFYAYSPSMNRLIIKLPVLVDKDGTTHTFWQGRDCTGLSTLKYYTGIGSTNRLVVIRKDAQRPTNKLFITEDITSAIRIAECGYDALPLRGTSCKDMTELANITLQYSNVHIWLDDDAAGRKGANILANRLSLVIPAGYGYSPSRYGCISNPLEAKEFSPEKLKEFVDGC